MVFWFIVRVTVLVMLQAGGDVGHRSMPRSGDWGDTACSVGVARIAMFCCFSDCGMSIAGVAISGGTICSIFCPLDALLKLHRFEDAAIYALHAGTQGLVTEEDDRYLIAFGHIKGRDDQAVTIC